MAKFKVVNNNGLDANLQGGAFNNDPSSPLTLGEFTLDTKIVQRKVTDYTSRIETFSAPITLDSLSIDIDTAKTVFTKKNELIFNIDKSDLSNYAYYGSLREFIRSSITDLISKYPYSLHSTPYVNDSFIINVYDYKFEPAINQSTFKIPASTLDKTYNIIYDSISSAIDPTKDLRVNYLNFVVYNPEFNVDTYFNILNLTPSNDKDNGYVFLTVKGNPFPNAVLNTYQTIPFHIKPNALIYNKFLNSLNNFGTFILGDRTDTGFRVSLKKPFKNERGLTLLFDQSFFWPTPDGYNLDTSSINYETFLTDLLDLGDTYDDYKTNIILRQLVPDSLLQYDYTDSLKVNKLLTIYGREIDETKKFIDYLSHLNKLSYNKINTTPDFLIKSFARTLGWDTNNILQDEDLFASVFNVNKNGDPISKVASEVDIELWRRLLLNTNYLFKSKGTRGAIEALFEFFGISTSFASFNEYIYTYDRLTPDQVQKLYDDYLNQVYPSLPYAMTDLVTTGGTINIMPDIDDLYFQIAGNDDRGQAYVNFYRNLGFNLVRTNDNQKSWSYTANDRVGDNFNYSLEDTALVFNTKEIEIDVDIAQAIEDKFFKDVKKYSYPLSANTQYYNCYINNYDTSIDWNKLSFAQFTDAVYSNYIDVRNRKVTTNEHTGTYFSLSQMFDDWQKFLPVNSKYTYNNLLTYVDKINYYLDKFVIDFIPATSIFLGVATKIRNTVFHQQKFTYKRGINCGSEFSNSLPPQYTADINTIQIVNKIEVPYSALLKVAESSASYGITKAVSKNDNDIIVGEYDSASGTVFVFDNPIYYVQTASKIVTGLTSNQYTYNLSSNTGDTLSFIFTGNTYNLTGNTNFLDFGYDIFDFNIVASGFNRTVKFSGVTNANYFRSGNTILNYTIPNNDLIDGISYLIKGYFDIGFIYANNGEIPTYSVPFDTYDNFDLFTYSNLYSKLNNGNVERFYDSLNPIPGFTLSQRENYNLLNYPYAIYNKDNDYYFMVVANPLPPLNTLDLPPLTFEGARLISERLPIVVSGQTGFFTTYQALGDVQLSLNGLTILPGQTIIIPPSGITGTTGTTGNSFTSGNTINNFEYQYSTNQNIKILYDDLLPRDILVVSYLTQGTGIQYQNENETVGSPIYSGVTATTHFYYNIISNTYEFKLNFTPDPLNDIFVYLNGQLLTNGLDYYQQPINKSRVVFNVPIRSNDIILIYYVNGNGILNKVYEIPGTIFPASWNSPYLTSNIPSDYEIQFCEDGDNFVNIIYFLDVPQAINTNTYLQNIDFLTINPLLWVGKTLNYRVVKRKIYNNILNEKLYTFNSSDVVRFKLLG